MMKSPEQAWLEETDEQGLSPMLRAVKSGNFSMTELVLAYEQRSAVDTGSLPAIHRAVLSEIPEMAEKCVAEGADVDEQDGHGDTALHRAVRMGDPMMALTLLCSGALPNLYDGLGLAPMHWAVLKGDQAMVEMLMQYGGEVNVRDSFAAMTPFTYAKLLGYDAMARRLARFGGSW